MHEVFDQLLVDEVEEGLVRVDQGHRDVERAEDGRIFDADHAGADDRRLRGSFVRLDDLVAVEHIDVR